MFLRGGRIGAAVLLSFLCCPALSASQTDTGENGSREGNPVSIVLPDSLPSGVDPSSLKRAMDVYFADVPEDLEFSTNVPGESRGRFHVIIRVIDKSPPTLRVEVIDTVRLESSIAEQVFGPRDEGAYRQLGLKARSLLTVAILRASRPRESDSVQEPPVEAEPSPIVPPLAPSAPESRLKALVGFEVSGVRWLNTNQWQASFGLFGGMRYGDLELQLRANRSLDYKNEMETGEIEVSTWGAGVDGWWKMVEAQRAGISAWSGIGLGGTWIRAHAQRLGERRSESVMTPQVDAALEVRWAVSRGMWVSLGPRVQVPLAPVELLIRGERAYATGPFAGAVAFRSGMLF